MKKTLIIFILSIVLLGCSNNSEEKSNTKEENKIVSKIDKNKDYVYYEDYKELNIGDKEYKLDIPVINLDSSNIEVVNIDIKSFIIGSYNEYEIDENNFISGKYIESNSYISDKYISLLIKYNRYNNGTYDEDNYIIYNIDINSGSTLDNSKILKEFDISEEELVNIVRTKLKSEDIEFSIMNMKKDYKLYIDKDSKLHLLFFEENDDEQIKRDLIVN